jgi:hypothetical protein
MKKKLLTSSTAIITDVKLEAKTGKTACRTKNYLAYRPISCCHALKRTRCKPLSAKRQVYMLRAAGSEVAKNG